MLAPHKLAEPRPGAGPGCSIWLSSEQPRTLTESGPPSRIAQPALVNSEAQPLLLG